MLKKISLFVLGMTGAVAAFWFYQYVSGVRPGTGARAKGPALSTSTAPGGTLIKERGPDAKLKYVIRATNSPEPVLQDGTPVPGQYIFVAPEATFYGDNGSTIELQADKGKFAFETPSKSTSDPLAGLNGKIKQMIRSGELSGHVRMRVTRPARGQKDRLAGVTYVYFEDPVSFDRVRGELASTGNVHVRADAMAFDGSGFKMGLNIEGKDFQDQFENLHIDRGDQIILRDVGNELDDLTGRNRTSDAQPAPTKTAVAPPPAKNQPAAATTQPKLPPTYLLTLQKNVQVESPNYALHGDRLALYYPAGNSKSDPISTALDTTTTAPGSASAPSDVPPPDAELAAPNIPVAPAPVAPKGDNDVTILWAGPLDLRLTEDNEPHLAAGDLQLEATGTEANPVTLHAAGKNQSPLDAVAGRVFYHQDEHRALLEPGTLPQVTAKMKDKGNAQCDKIEIVEVDKRQMVYLTGPGVLIQNADAGDRYVQWKKLMTIESADTGNNNFEPRHIVFDGAALKIPREHSILDMTADKFDVLFAPAKKKSTEQAGSPATAAAATRTPSTAKGSDPLPEHLLATGHVYINSRQRYDLDDSGNPIPLAKQTDRGEESGIRDADRLEILTTPGADGPEITQLLADGKDGPLSAWSYTDRPTKDEKAGMASTNLADINPPKYPDLRRETISASKLAADLKPKPKVKPEGSAKPKADDFDVDVTHFVAKDGVKIVQTPAWSAKASPTLISAHAIDATQVPAKDLPAPASPGEKLPNMSATIVASDDPKDRVHLSAGKNMIEAREVVYDAKTQNFSVPGAGVADLEKRDDADPRKSRNVHITWEKSFLFDNTGEKPQAIFIGNPEATVRNPKPAIDNAQGTDPTEDPKLGGITCYDVPTPKQSPSLPHSLGKMTVNFKRVPADATGTQTANQNRFNPEFDSLDAQGQVEANGAMIEDNVNDANVTISANVDAAGNPGNLHYATRDSQSYVEIPGPGAMVVDLHLPKDKTKPKDAKDPSFDSNGVHAFHWDKDFNFDTKTNLVTFAGKVLYVFTPQTPFFNKAESLGLLANSQTTRQGEKPDPLYLDTDLLTAQFLPASNKPASGTSKTKAAPSPIGLDSLGNLQPQSIVAQNGAKLTIGKDEKQTVAAGAQLHFDVPANLIEMTGNGQDPVLVTQGNKNSVSYSKMIVHLKDGERSYEFYDARDNISIAPAK